MSDIPNRLRELAADLETGTEKPPQYTLSLLREAADRIEYLESVAGAVSQGDRLTVYDKRYAGDKTHETSRDG